MGAQPAISGITTLLDLCVELGYLTRAQVDEAIAEQKQLQKGKLNLRPEQILLQRRLLTPAQIKTLGDEMDLRRARATMHVGLTHSQRIASLKFFGKYDLVQLLSEKGYTRVYKAFDTDAQRAVVLKVLPPNLSAGSQWIERFRREMYLAANLDHPNLVTTYECGAVDGSPYIAMEYLEGVSLAFRLEREGNLPEFTAWVIIRECAKGLAHAEEHGIVHRDIKPENVLLTREGRVKVIDMGLAKSLVVASSVTHPGETVGTPLYMAPEQAQGKREIDSRTDIYGLGASAYHLLTGSVPFYAENATDVMHKHINEPRPDPRDTLPELCSATTKMLQRMMATDPAQRQDGFKALVNELNQLLLIVPETQAARHFLPRIRISD